MGCGENRKRVNTGNDTFAGCGEVGRKICHGPWVLFFT